MVMGISQSTNPAGLEALVLTKDHKPEDMAEQERITRNGGRIQKCRHGETRVVWQKPNAEPVPLLNIARSLGDLWSYTLAHNDYYVSPIPDVTEYCKFRNGHSILYRRQVH